MHRFCCSIYCCSCCTLLLHTTFQAIQTLTIGIVAIYFFINGGLDGGGKFLCREHIGIFVALFSLSPIFILELLTTIKCYQLLSQVSGNEPTKEINQNLRILFYLKTMFTAVLLLLAWALANLAKLDPMYIVVYACIDIMIAVLSGAAILLRVGQVRWESGEDPDAYSLDEDEDQLLAVISLSDEKDEGKDLEKGGNAVKIFAFTV